MLDCVPGIWNCEHLVAILEVAVGLGLVIFVHELGHFIVAKLCGVKCEKFYLGFDIGGLKLCKFRWGETEYGIGILPAGRLREDARPGGQPRTAARGDRAGQAARRTRRPAGGLRRRSRVGARQALFDPRSYLAQSVPRRMAIISAGVMMNLIFALLAAIIAYGVRRPRGACRVGELIPGEGAWQADMRPGDKILEVSGRRLSSSATFSRPSSATCRTA